MATSNIKLFDENKGNIMPDETYVNNAQRLNGVQSGIASSQLQNKFQYQVSLVAYALGQIMIANGYDALDSAAVSAFVNNMSSSLLQKVVDKANQTQAQSGTDDTKYMTSAKVKLLIDYILSHNITIPGNVTFTGTVSGQSPVADNNFTTKKYVDDSIEKLGIKTIRKKVALKSFDRTDEDGTININFEQPINSEAVLAVGIYAPATTCSLGEGDDTRTFEVSFAGTFNAVRIIRKSGKAENYNVEKYFRNSFNDTPSSDNTFYNTLAYKKSYGFTLNFTNYFVTVFLFIAE